MFWLSTLEDDELDTAFANVASTGVKVVRTWAFDDVARKPSSGNYFQVCSSPALVRLFFISFLRFFTKERR